MKWQNTILLIVCLSSSVSTPVEGAAQVNEATKSHTAVTELRKGKILAMELVSFGIYWRTDIAGHCWTRLYMSP
jgi:hypothetical protein